MLQTIYLFIYLLYQRNAGKKVHRKSMKNNRDVRNILISGFEQHFLRRKSLLLVEKNYKSVETSH